MPSKKNNKSRKGKKNGNVKKSTDATASENAGISCGYLVLGGDAAKDSTKHADGNNKADILVLAQFKVSDEDLFKPPPPKEDCNICFLPLKDAAETKYQECCGKQICCGCYMVGMGRDHKWRAERPMCPFCRAPEPSSNGEAIRRLKKRLKLDDAMAFYVLGNFYRRGGLDLPQDVDKGFELLFRAAELGSFEAHLNLGFAYNNGNDGLEQDVAKAVHHYQIAAMGGILMARHNLGCMENQGGNEERAVKHWAISASAGLDQSLKCIKEGYTRGYVSKDEFAKILRSWKESSDEMKSGHRHKIKDKLQDEGYRMEHPNHDQPFMERLEVRGALRQAAANASAAGTPTACVEIRNFLCDNLENDDQYAVCFEETRENCSKFGALQKVIIPRSGPGASKIFLEYQTAEEAGKVIAALGGMKAHPSLGGHIEVVYCDPECLCMHNWLLSIQTFAAQDAVTHSDPGLWKGM